MTRDGSTVDVPPSRYRARPGHLPTHRSRCAAGVLAAVMAASLAACAGGAERPAGAPSDARLQQIARSAASSGSSVRVRLVDGVAYLTGNIDSRIDESAVERALLKVAGVDRVESALQSSM